MIFFNMITLVSHYNLKVYIKIIEIQLVTWVFQPNGLDIIVLYRKNMTAYVIKINTFSLS